MDFNEFCRQNKKESVEENIKAEQFFPKDEDAKRVYDKYKDFTHDELMKEILKYTQEKKNDGTLNNQKLDEIEKNLSPYLTNQQRENLSNIIKRLK